MYCTVYRLKNIPLRIRSLKQGVEQMPSLNRYALVIVLGCAAILASSITQLPAEVTLPTGLAPGTQYQIAFITSGTTIAESSDIEYYNAFVTTQAAPLTALLPAGVTWKAIASTDAVSANVNAAYTPGIEIYNTNGEPVTDSTHPLYPPGEWAGNLVHPIHYNENGIDPDPNNFHIVWTGSSGEGSRNNWGGVDYALGSPQQPPYISNVPVAGTGQDKITWYGWIYSGNQHQNQSSAFQMYGLSSPITVVPEPNTLCLLLAGLLGLGGAHLARRRGGAQD
jgi:hypothetical protein